MTDYAALQGNLIAQASNWEAGDFMSMDPAFLREAAAAISALTKEVEEAREAMAPFASARPIEGRSRGGYEAVKEAKFTPGPWRLDATYDPRNGLCVLAGKRWICGEIDNDIERTTEELGVHHGMSPPDVFALQAENAANGCLIAAAPDMHEVLTHLATLDDRHIFGIEASTLRNWLFEYRAQARAALEKAVPTLSSTAPAPEGNSDD